MTETSTPIYKFSEPVATPGQQFNTEELLQVFIRHLLADRENCIAQAIADERLLAALGREVSKPLCGR
jgi:hypothetical protein